jgi:elongation factor Ts
MMECKKALVETDGDIDAAIELMRKSGQAKAAKKAGRTAAEGVVVIKQANEEAVLVEVNCETDFVAKDANFASFASAVAERALDGGAQTLEELLASPLRDGEPNSVEQAREALVAKLGENMSVRRFERVEAGRGKLHSYRHGVRIAVVVSVEGGDDTLGKDLAMHIAASNPMCVSTDDVAADAIAKEREIHRAQVLAEGKPEAIVDKIVDGKIRKWLGEITLLGQPFVKDPDMTVEKLLEQSGAKVLGFRRLEVGEGIEKRQENFADEVMSQTRGH